MICLFQQLTPLFLDNAVVLRLRVLQLVDKVLFFALHLHQVEKVGLDVAIHCLHRLLHRLGVLKASIELLVPDLALDLSDLLYSLFFDILVSIHFFELFIHSLLDVHQQTIILFLLLDVVLLELLLLLDSSML